MLLTQFGNRACHICPPAFRSVAFFLQTLKNAPLTKITAMLTLTVPIPQAHFPADATQDSLVMGSFVTVCTGYFA